MNYLARSDLLESIADRHGTHQRQSDWWRAEDELARNSMQELKGRMLAGEPFEIGEIGPIRFSYVDMGAISSLELFGLDELIIFAFYWRNRARYPSSADMGANIGLHTIVMKRFGMSTASYEPDPVHVSALKDNLGANGLSTDGVTEAAVNTEGGHVEFVRVVGNTTGSHVAGAKESPYGGLERFEVRAIPFRETVRTVDLVKMDVEGLEADLLTQLHPDDFGSLDIICEVGTAVNAARVFTWFHGSSVNLFSQKTNWGLVRMLDDMPNSYRDGSLFLSSREEMPWD